MTFFAHHVRIRSGLGASFFAVKNEGRTDTILVVDFPGRLGLGNLSQDQLGFLRPIGTLLQRPQAHGVIRLN